ncbi:hypothetical protein [Burkholderia sp. S171]|uniref:hypothetical protein n=1 Tax=Burkholderia sp. S171 TaxID=1641860 RepID=UPI00131C267E|nr:hypothetical protein [Burkholderia sp. S171]
MRSNTRSTAWTVRAASTLLLVCTLVSVPSLAQVGYVTSPTISANDLRKGCSIFFQKDFKYSDSDPLSSNIFNIQASWMCVGSQQIAIDRYEIEGSSPEILTVLFWKHQRAVILVRWATSSQASDFQGDYYRVYVYDYRKNNVKKPFVGRNDIDKRFGEGWDGILNGKKILYRYKDAKSIRSRLNKIGY